jgi:hypothetical protein
MGRELRRVPLDFAWPLNKVWGGYLNPFYEQSTKCDACGGCGYSPKAALYADQWYGHNYNTGDKYVPFDPVAYGAKPLRRDHPKIRAMAERNCEGRGEAAISREVDRLFRDCFSGRWSQHLIQDDVDALVENARLHELTSQWDGKEWAKTGHHPTADEVNDWSIGGAGHDSINQYTCVEARCKREGVDVHCSKCVGKGKLWPSEEIEQQCEDWERTPPPSGPGYQLWETTSEGSPVSPVFETLDALCAYAETHCSTFGSFKTSAAEWKRMLDDGFVHHREGNFIFL